MPYESPNIVLVGKNATQKANPPTSKDTDNKKIQNTLLTGHLAPNNEIVSKIPKVTVKSTAVTKFESIKVVNLTNLNQEYSSKPKVVQPEGSNKNTDTGDVKKPMVSVFNYKVIVGGGPKMETIKDNLPPTSKDEVSKQTTISTDKNKSDQEIKINLLPRLTVAKTNTTAGAPTSNSLNSSAGASADTVWTPPPESEPTTIQWSTNYSHLVQIPTNQSIESQHCPEAAATFSSLSQNQINMMSTNFTPPWTHPTLLETTSYQNLHTTDYATWSCPPQFQPGPYINKTWTHPSQVHTFTNQSNNSSPCMDITPTFPQQSPIPPSSISDFRPRMDTKTYFIQESHKNTSSGSIDKNNSTSSSGSPVHKEVSNYTKAISQDASSTSFKSRMDYTWLTRAHYANVNHSNKNPSKDKPASISKNTEDHAKKSNINFLSKDSTKPIINNNSKCKEYSSERVTNKDTNIKKPSGIEKIATSTKFTEEIRENDKNNIIAEIKSLEMKIKKLQKIPKLPESKKYSVEPRKMKSEINSQTKQIKSICNTTKLSDKNDNEKFQATQKRRSSAEQTPNKKRIRYSSEDPKSEQKLIHRKQDTQISGYTKKEKTTRTSDNNRREIKKPDVDLKNKYERRSLVERHGTENFQIDRKRQGSIDERIPKKRFRYESEIINNTVKTNPINSIATSSKPTAKYPWVHAPLSNDSDVGLNFKSDFDLRSKLNYKLHTRNKIYDKTQVNDKAEKPRENLIITVHPNVNDKTTTSPPEESLPPKQKTKKIKKIRLVINVIQEDTTDDSSSDDNKDSNCTGSNNHFVNRKSDLSFLDDINIDEIVNSLQSNPDLDNVRQQQNVQKEDIQTSNELMMDKFTQPTHSKTGITNPLLQPEQQLKSNKSTANKFVQPIIIKKEFISEQSMEPQIQTQNILNTKNTTECITKKFVQPIIVKKEILTEPVDPQIQSQQVENIKTTSKSIPVKFVQPIIIKEELITEPTELQMQSNNKNAAKNSPDNVTNLEFKKSNIEEQRPDKVFTAVNNITSDVFTHNIKQEIHEDQTINTDNTITENIFFQKSLYENVPQSNAQLIDKVAKNTQPLINNSNSSGIIHKIKSEACNNIDDNKFSKLLIFEQDNLDLLDTDKNIESPANLIFNKGSKDLYSSKSLELNKNVGEFNETTIENFQEGNNYEVTSNKEKYVNLKESQVIVEKQTNNTLVSNNRDNNKSRIIGEINMPIINNTKKHQSIDSSTLSFEAELENKYLDTFYTNNQSNYDFKNNNVVKDTHNTNITELRKQVQNEKIVIIDNDTEKCNTDSGKTIDIEESVKALKLKEQAYEDKPDFVKLNIVNKNKSKKSTNDEQLYNNANTNTTNNFTIIKNSRDIIEVSAVEDGTGTTKLKEVSEDKSATNIITTEDENLDIQTKTVKNPNNVVNTLNGDDGGAVKQKVEEQTVQDKLETNIFMKSDFITDDKNKKSIETLELQQNATVDIKTVTSKHPSLKSNKDLIDKVEDKLFYYFKRKYSILSIIHKGKFSKVFKCKDESDKNYTLKILENGHDTVRFGIKKQELLKELQQDIPKVNSNIVNLINGFGMDQTWCFLMEYYPTNLALALKKTVFSMDAVQELAKQLVTAVLVMRSNNIVHSDIKPSHILVNSNHNRLKVCGFDEAYYVDEKRDVLPNIGTAHYRAPEVILGHSAGYSIDVWATAVVMYEMVTGLKLFPMFYNSNTLFSQMCLCGELPLDMMLRSRYSNKHFVGTVFKRVVGPCGEHELYNTNKLNVKNYMYNILINICNQRWYQGRPNWKQVRDLAKLAQMSTLLDKMLVLEPSSRLPIEYVYSDPFFMHTSN